MCPVWLRECVFQVRSKAQNVLTAALGTFSFSYRDLIPRILQLLSPQHTTCTEHQFKVTQYNTSSGSKCWKHFTQHEMDVKNNSSHTHSDDILHTHNLVYMSRYAATYQTKRWPIMSLKEMCQTSRGQVVRFHHPVLAYSLCHTIVLQPTSRGSSTNSGPISAPSCHSVAVPGPETQSQSRSSAALNSLALLINGFDWIKTCRCYFIALLKTWICIITLINTQLWLYACIAKGKATLPIYNHLKTYFVFFLA